jgi:hypothetical protein
MAIRNPRTHRPDVNEDQVALEELAAPSLLARWIDDAVLELWLAKKRRAESRSCFFGHSREYVGIDRERDGGGGVAQHFGHHLDRDPGRQHE